MFLLPADSADSADRADVVYTETGNYDSCFQNCSALTVSDEHRNDSAYVSKPYWNGLLTTTVIAFSQR